MSSGLVVPLKMMAVLLGLGLAGSSGVVAW